MTLEEYKNILITGTPSDRARAIAEAGNDRSLTAMMAETGEP